jgi:Putative Ig domain
MPVTMADSIKTLGKSLLGILLISTGGVACDFAPVAAARQTPAQSAAAGEQAERPIQIENESDLPDTYPHAPYTLHFQARGGVPVLHWRVERGALPPGMTLEENGLLYGAAERTGEFQFTVAVRDGGQPQAAVQKAFTLRVRSALSLRWKTPAHVNGNRIEGSVDVSNTTPDDIDLTFIVMAVAGNGRATAIGYQHFVLRAGTAAMELPFGDTLPHGGYVVHVDAVGEVAAKDLIYRDRMVTPAALQVTVGP